jgi:hypothetical protein
MLRCGKREEKGSFPWSKKNYRKMNFEAKNKKEFELRKGKKGTEKRQTWSQGKKTEISLRAFFDLSCAGKEKSGQRRRRKTNAWRATTTVAPERELASSSFSF